MPSFANTSGLSVSGWCCNDQMKFITEAEHVHSSSDFYNDQFEELKIRLGIDSLFE